MTERVFVIVCLAVACLFLLLALNTIYKKARRLTRILFLLASAASFLASILGSIELRF